MNGRGSYKNVKFTKPDSPSPSGAEPDVSYAELHFKTLSTPRVRTDRGGLNPTYSELNLRKEKPRIDEDEEPPISSGPGGLSPTAETAAKVKIRNKTHRLICLLCLVTSAFILIVAGLSILVSQIRQSQITSNRNYNELNSTFQSKLSSLNSNLSDLERMYSDLRHQFAEMETKYRSVNETKAKICELLTRRRVETCSKNWVKNKERCYYFSTFETSLYRAIHECSKRDSWLLEINSSDETSFVSRNIFSSYWYYWFGKCKSSNVGFGLVYKDSSVTTVCSQCDLTAVRRGYPCDRDSPFICEKSAAVFPDIPEKIQDLCRQPVERT